jgi:hypothetical protein
MIQFDVVIPVHKKDLSILEYCIASAKKYLIGARKVIIISKEKYSENADWIDEASFPFSIEEIEKYVGQSRGWYFQQLLKLYSPIVIPGILENVMVLDSDTVFFRPMRMFDCQGRPFYNINKDTRPECIKFDLQVNEHIKKLLPEIAAENLPKKFSTSCGVSHNMIFNRKIMLELFQKVEAHDAQMSSKERPDITSNELESDKFWRIFLKHSTETHCASEYQIYFNFVVINYPNQVTTGRRRYKNTSDPNISRYKNNLRYYYCSFHHYLRNKRQKNLRSKIRNFFPNLFRSLFKSKLNNIGLVNRNIAQFLTIPNQKISWLRHAKSKSSITAVSTLEHNGENFLIFTRQKNSAKKYKLVLAKLDCENAKIINETKLLKSHDKLHHSTLKDGKSSWLILANSEKKNLSLYELNTTRATISKKSEIFSDEEIQQCDLILYKNKYWIFYSSKGSTYIAYSNSLEEKFTKHSQNPILSTELSGKIFTHNESLYLPVRNPGNSFNQSIMIKRITQLTPDSYQDCDETEITPNQFGKYPLGISDLTAINENYSLIVGKKFIFRKFS